MSSSQQGSLSRRDSSAPRTFMTMLLYMSLITSSSDGGLYGSPAYCLSWHHRAWYARIQPTRWPTAACSVFEKATVAPIRILGLFTVCPTRQVDVYALDFISHTTLAGHTWCMPRIYANTGQRRPLENTIRIRLGKKGLHSHKGQQVEPPYH